MAGRIRKCEPDLMHEDLMGFVPTMCEIYNIRSLSNAIEYLKRKREKRALMFSDADKVFNNVLVIFNGSIAKCELWNKIFKLDAKH